MNPLALFIGRPVATTLLTLGMTMAGLVSYFLLPVSPLPQVDIPTIVVYANMPGASPETMASSVATPLERHLGVIADVTEMTSTSAVGSSNIVLQFGLGRDIDGAARDIQAAINASRADLPASLRSNPGYWKINPADIPILILAMTSPTLTPAQLYDSAATVLQQKLSQLEGVGQVRVSGSSLPAVRVELNPAALFKYGIGMEDVRAALASDSPGNAANNTIVRRGRSSISAGAAVTAASEPMVPLDSFPQFRAGITPLAVNYHGYCAATAVSFIFPFGKSMSDGVAVIAEAERNINMLTTVHGIFAGTARAFQKSLDNLPYLILANLRSVCIMLGILYESYSHRLTILSSLPSAGVGAIPALIACNHEFLLTAFIGIVMLICIVITNGIMLLDFALASAITDWMASRRSIMPACCPSIQL